MGYLYLLFVFFGDPLIYLLHSLVLMACRFDLSVKPVLHMNFKVKHPHFSALKMRSLTTVVQFTLLHYTPLVSPSECSILGELWIHMTYRVQ